MNVRSHLIQFFLLLQGYSETEHLDTIILFHNSSLFAVIILLLALRHLLSFSPLQVLGIRLFLCGLDQCPIQVSNMFCLGSSISFPSGGYLCAFTPPPPLVASIGRLVILPWIMLRRNPNLWTGRVGQPLNSNRNDAPCY